MAPQGVPLSPYGVDTCATCDAPAVALERSPEVRPSTVWTGACAPCLRVLREAFPDTVVLAVSR